LKRVDTISKVRLAFQVEGWSMKKISRELNLPAATPLIARV
jgi:hypothetical protein